MHAFHGRKKQCCQVAPQSNANIISNLPEDIIQLILEHLPLEDAVRMSVLSTKWRYRWHSISEIDFFGCNSRLRRLRSWSDFVNVVNHVLLHVSSPIQSLKLELSPFWHSYSPSTIDSWICLLSNYGVKTLCLDCRPPPELAGVDTAFLRNPSLYYEVPSRLFYWKDLYFLELICGIFKIPSVFTGLSSEPCPLLESAVLKGKAIAKTCGFLEALGPLCLISNLMIKSSFFEVLFTKNVPKRMSTSYSNLRVLRLIINFVGPDDIMTILCLCRSSRNLSELHITLWGNFEEEKYWLWDDQDLDCSFNHLQYASMFGISGTVWELEFARYLLASAPMLNSFCFKVESKAKAAEQWIFKNLMSPQRASAQAEVHYLGECTRDLYPEERSDDLQRADYRLDAY